MFIGHPATGFLAKRVAARTSLGWLVLAPFFLDILWPVFLLTGVGLGLWNSVTATVAVEGAFFVAGVAIYSRLTRARDRIGSIGWWTLIALFVLIYAGNLFGPPPPDVKTIAVVGLLLVLFPIWAWWVDRHRLAR